MALYLALGTIINNLVTINPDMANSWFGNFAKYMITYRLINMDAALIANTYLFATKKINKWTISADISLHKLCADTTLIAKHPEICMWMQQIESLVLPVIAIIFVAMCENTNKLVPFI